MPSNLTLAVFKDRDLLFALERVANAEGLATAEEIAESIGIDHERPTQCVAMRLGWLRRFGVVDRRKETDDLGRHLWHLSDKGFTLIHPTKLSSAAQKALNSLDEGQRVAVTELVASQMRHASREGIHLSRRAFKHHIGGWRDETIALARKGNK